MNPATAIEGAPGELGSASMPRAAAVPTSSRGGFLGYRDGLIHSWLRILTVLGFCLIPLFLILDYFTMPEELRSRFVWYRLATTAVVLGQYFVIRKTPPSRYSYLHGYVFTVVVGAMIVQMTVDLGGFDSAYYAGLNLVVVAVNVLLPWRAVHSAVNGLLVLCMYVGANALFGGPFSGGTMINNLYFLAATVIIAVAITHTKHQLIAQEYRLRAELLSANENLDASRSELKAARDALWGEMEVAKRIQTALLPAARALGPYQVDAVMLPAEEVGGDYYDFIETRSGEQWLAVGDVSGHGVESGLVMMMTQTSILSMVENVPDLSPSAVFRAVNRVLRENISRLGTHRYMTLNVVRVREDRLTVSGKHQDLLVYRKARDEVEFVSNQGCWIGVAPDSPGMVDDLDVPMAPGDMMLLFTDGVTEAADARGEMFGDERLARAFRRVTQLPLAVALQTLLWEVTGFQARQEDDITLVLVRRDEAPA